MIEKLIKDDSIAKTIFSHSNEGLIISDGNGEIRYANPKALEMFGYEYDTLIGERVEILVPDNLKHKHVHNRKDYEKAPSNRFMGVGRHLLGKNKDGRTFPIEISLSPFHFQDHNYVLSFISNITKRKEQEDKVSEMVHALDKSSKELQLLNISLEAKVNERTLELAETIKKLQESQKATEKALEREKEVNSLKSKFISTASHEFRTPLATIISSLSLIEQYQSKPEKQAKHFTRITNSVDYLLKILNDMLTIEKTDVIETNFTREELDFIEAINQIITDLKPAIKDQQSIVFEHPASVKAISNEYLFRNVMVNLVGNAIKYSKADGEVIIKITETKDAIRLKVKDNGIGIPKAEQVHVFDRFYRSSNSVATDGTGLGLYIVKKNIDVLGGTINFESEENQGTIFSVTIPKN
jgi:PAS domain S-box-containing protein